jgi:hypothetical protein
LLLRDEFFLLGKYSGVWKNTLEMWMSRRRNNGEMAGAIAALCPDPQFFAQL